MTHGPPVYEPRYYERSAQRHMTQHLGVSLFINTPWGLAGSPASRPEIDAVALLERRVVPIEIKAYHLDIQDIEEIHAKYNGLGFRRLILVAPGVSRSAAHSLATRNAPSTEIVIFHPVVTKIAEWYDHVWPRHVPGWVHSTLSTGLHHIRFVLSQPTYRGGFVVGQQRSRVYGVDTLSHLLRRLPSPPVRLLWTPLRFTIPRDVITRRSRLTPLGGFVPVDIDGDRLHRAFHACEIALTNDSCQFCLRYARHEQERLFEQLTTRPIAVVTSGSRGVHIYYPDDGAVRGKLLHLANRRAIRLDENVTASIKATVALPGSLHAGNHRPVASQDDRLSVDEAVECS